VCPALASERRGTSVGIGEKLDGFMRYVANEHV
jgi:hypothetical protein